MSRLEAGSMPLQAMEFRCVGRMRGLPTELPMVSVKSVLPIWLFAATANGPGHAQVGPWQERIEIVAKTVVVHVEPTRLQVPELFDPALWDIEVAGRPAKVLAVQKLLTRSVHEQQENVNSFVPSLSLPTKGAAAGEESGTTILLLSRACDPRNLGRSVTKLTSEVEELLLAGPVSVGVVDKGVRILCSQVTKAGELRACLELLRREKTGNDILTLRKWARDVHGISQRVASLAGLVEETAINRALFREVTDAVRLARVGAGLVVLVWDGADGDPWGFWGEFARERESSEKDKGAQKRPGSRTLIDGANLGREWSEIEDWAQEFAVDGKVVVSVFPGFGASMYPDWAASFSGSRRFRELMDARQEWQPSRGASEYLLLGDAHRVPRFMAEVTGGTVINPKDTVKDAWRRLDGALAITFQIEGPTGCDTSPVTISHRTLGRPLRSPRGVRFCFGADVKPDLMNLLETGKGCCGEISVRAQLESFEKKPGKTSEAMLRLEWNKELLVSRREENVEGQWRITMAVNEELG